MHYRVEGPVIKETIDIRGTLPPSVISELSEKVGSITVTMDRFFSKRIERTTGIFFSLDLTSISSFAYHNGSAYKYEEYEVGIIDSDDGTGEYIIHVPQNHNDSARNNEIFSKSKKLKAFVVYDPRKASDDIDSVMSIVNDIELKLENTKHDDPAMTYAELSPFIRRFFDSEMDEKGMMHIIRKHNEFTFTVNRAGMSVMLSSTNTTCEQMMTSYDVRDSVKKAFVVYKYF